MNKRPTYVVYRSGDGSKRYMPHETFEEFATVVLTLFNDVTIIDEIPADAVFWTEPLRNLPGRMTAEQIAGGSTNST
jgi:hypothetical protein